MKINNYILKPFLSVLTFLLLSSFYYIDQQQEGLLYPFESLKKGSKSMMNDNYCPKDNIIIESEFDFHRLWISTIGNTFDKPTIDFNHNMVLAFYYGAPTTGYTIQVEKIIEFQSKLQVYLVLKIPLRGLTVNTCPYEIIKIKKTIKKLEIVTREIKNY